MLILQEQPNQNNEMKIGDSVLFSLFMRVNISATFLTTPSTGLSGIQFPILNILESLIPKDRHNQGTSDEFT